MTKQLSLKKRALSMDEVFFTKDHFESLPTVRIKQIEISNFKSVKYGKILFDCGKHYVPYGTKSDILGIYGQNGSGKTTLIDVLYILKCLMAGTRIPDEYSECISVGEEFASFVVSFDLQYPSGEIRTLDYSCSLNKVKVSDEELGENFRRVTFNLDNTEDVYRVNVISEKFSLSGKDLNNNVTMIKQVFIDTANKKAPFGPASKLEEFIGTDEEKILKLAINKKLTQEKSKSFIFDKETLQIFKNSGRYSPYYQVLLEMNWFALHYFYVIGTRSAGIIRLNFELPIYTRHGMLRFGINEQQIISTEDFELFDTDFNNINKVLSQLVPSLSIGLKKLSNTLTREGDPAFSVMPVATRNGVEIPLSYESDGVRRIISLLTLIIAAYNDQSCTLAIDEFDAGIFEYLLGEILQVFEESGKGQFIFTSHNLRPLEVIDKKFIVFTTTNPNNRYYRLKNISTTSNLRDTYFREIILGEQEEELYKRTKSFKIESAMKEVGRGEM